jgi:DNA invertase Pin-like site-specific DNA recombinase
VVLVDGYIGLAPGTPPVIASMQRRQIANWAADHGWSVGRVFEERAVPKRPHLREALDRVCARESDGIVVITLAHLGDSPEEALALVERVVAAGGKFVSVRDGIDLSTASGRQLFGVLIALCEWWRVAPGADTNVRGPTIYATPQRGYGAPPSGINANHKREQ